MMLLLYYCCTFAVQRDTKQCVRNANRISNMQLNNINTELSVAPRSISLALKTLQCAWRAHSAISTILQRVLAVALCFKSFRQP
jgi:hypothetical protein